MTIAESWHEEQESAWLYRSLSKSEREPRMASLFAELAVTAERQAAQWEDRARDEGLALPAFAPSPRVRLVSRLAAAVGPRRMRPALAALKIRGLSAYDAPTSGHDLPTDVTGFGSEHRTAGGGNLRAAVFGINDGLVSNASLILGMVGAQSSNATVLAAGTAGLLAGALSMAAGEYVSVRSQRELFEYQIGLERKELAEYPEAEAEELALIYAARGVPLEEARTIAARLVSRPEQALDVLAREELGLNPDDLGSPIGAAGFSFVAFTVGALVPLVPFFLGSVLPTSAYLGAALAAAGLFGTGAMMSLFSGKSPFAGGMRMLGIGGGAGALTFAIGSLFGG